MSRQDEINILMSPAMMNVARRIARGRSEYKRKAARQAGTTFGAGNTHMANTLLGVQGEMIVAKYVRGEMDIQNYTWKDDKPGDVYVERGGLWLEVKACQMVEPDIKAYKRDKEDGDKQYDIMVGVSVAQSATRMFGWCTRREFYENCEDKNYGYGKRDVLPFAKHEEVLHPMPELLDFLDAEYARS